MARKRRPDASRDAALRRLAIGAALAALGLGAGALLGSLAIGGGFGNGNPAAPSFAGLSSNPDALVADTGVSAPPCPECADSYGVGARLSARHDRRMSEPFRELGAVENDVVPLPVEPDDDYRYGGRFPDTEPPLPAGAPTMVLPVAIPDQTSGPPAAEHQKGPGEPPSPAAPPQ